MQNDTRKIMWLASYPKSGNTWMRAFLANYLIRREPGVPLSLAELNKMSSGDSSATEISRIAGADHKEIGAREVYAARHRMLEEFAALPTPTFIKTHMPNAGMFDIRIIPAELTRCAIYIARNPLDMVISYADHMGTDLAGAAAQIGSQTTMIGFSEKQINQLLGSWSMHVRSWQAIDAFPVLYLRYEEMLQDPERSFARVIRHIGAPLDETVLKDAIAVTGFESLKALEEAEGFVEKMDRQERFFRKGERGQWRDILPPEVVEKICTDHGEVMRELGYLRAG